MTVQQVRRIQGAPNHVGGTLRSLGMPERVGACFSSWQQAHVAARGALIRDHLLRPLDAELLLSLTFRHDDTCKSAASLRSHSAACYGVANNLRALISEAVTLSLQPMPRTSDFVRSLESGTHWGAILAVINATPGMSCRRNPSWTSTPGTRCSITRIGPMRTHRLSIDCADSTPYKCNGLRGGNVVFAPVIGNAKLHILHQLHGHRQCLRLMQSHEARQGFRYSRVVWSRLETVWLVPHPPLSWLDARCAWLPFGEDYSGLNDRHALLPRTAADAYLGRYDALLDGTVMNVSRALSRGRFGELSEEKYLQQTMARFNVPVCRFPSAAFLSCCEHRQVLAGCNSGQCLWRTVPGASTDMHRRLAGKYKQEIETAIQQAAAYSLPGAALVLQEPTLPSAELPPAGNALRIVVDDTLRDRWVANMSAMYFKPGYRRGRAATKAAKAPGSRRAYGVAWRRARNATAVTFALRQPRRAQVLLHDERITGRRLGSRRPRCSRLLVKRYEPSEMEQRWIAAVAEAKPRNCVQWLPPDGVLHKLAVSTAAGAMLPSARSHLVLGSPEGLDECADNGEMIRDPIEPLTSFLRSPRALAPDTSGAAIFDKGWLVLPSPVVVASVLRARGRFILVDLGAGLFDAGGRTPGAVNGSSLKWLTTRYEQIGVTFDRIIAFEARAFRPAVLWKSMPVSIAGKLQYYNVPADPRVGAKLNPWEVLMGVAHESDYVVVKLDVDHAATELELIHQLLDPRGRVGRLVDELFWEHHVAGSALCCPKLWRWREPTGLGWARVRFNRSNVDETLAGSFELFGRLRRMGIRAHSWV